MCVWLDDWWTTCDVRYSQPLRSGMHRRTEQPCLVFTLLYSPWKIFWQIGELGSVEWVWGWVSLAMQLEVWRALWAWSAEAEPRSDLQMYVPQRSVQPTANDYNLHLCFTGPWWTSLSCIPELFGEYCFLKGNKLPLKMSGINTAFKPGYSVY